MAPLGFGVTMYRGQLMDASCYNQNRETTGKKVWVQCVPSASTTSFALRANGKVRMLNDAGNNKAMAAYQEGLLKINKRGDMNVTVDGSRHGDTINVEGISARGSNTSVH